MNFSKTLTSVVAAASIVGAVGLAYAQTTSEPSSPAVAPTTPVTEPATQAPADPSSTPAPATTTSDTSSEPMPKADRN